MSKFNTTVKGQISGMNQDETIQFAKYCQYGDIGWLVLKSQIVKAIRETLVVSNKQSIDLVANKIIELIKEKEPNVNTLKDFIKVYKSGMQ